MATLIAVSCVFFFASCCILAALILMKTLIAVLASFSSRPSACLELAHWHLPLARCLLPLALRVLLHVYLTSPSFYPCVPTDPPMAPSCLNSGREKPTCCPAAMECLANITSALGELVSPHMNSLLEPLFSNGLSEQVCRLV